MTDAQIITDNAGKVTGIVINSTRYSPEAIMLMQANSISPEQHEHAIKTWKEFAAAALNGQEEERCLRLEAEQTIAAMVDAMFKRGDTAEAIGRVMRYARDYTALRTETAFEGLVRSLREYDELRKRLNDGR